MENTVKYIIDANDTTVVDGVVFSRIRATRDIPLYNVRVGDKGGFVVDDTCLSHTGNCWIGENACVAGRVKGDAYVHGNAIVCLGVRVEDHAEVFGHAIIFGGRITSRAKVYDYAKVYHSSYIHGNARVFGNSIIECVAEVFGHAMVYDYAKVTHGSKVSGNAKVYDHAEICGEETGVTYSIVLFVGGGIVTGNAEIFGNGKVQDTAIISGNVRIHDHAIVGGNVHLNHHRCDIGGHAKFYENADVAIAMVMNLLDSVYSAS